MVVETGEGLRDGFWDSLPILVIAVNTSPGGNGLRCSCICWRRSATWAARTRCRSAMRRHFGHRQSLHRQKPLWPFKIESKPWFRHRAHFGVRFFSEDCAVCDWAWACLPLALFAVATVELLVVKLLPPWEKLISDAALDRWTYRLGWLPVSFRAQLLVL